MDGVGSGGLMRAMMAGTVVMLVVLVTLVWVGVRVVLATERERNHQERLDSARDG